ncbi:MAG: pyruvate dehydrogenase (acetyl-transferring), homodimeric type [Actinomycetota bacterium]|nr:pyruvate dehydrogenase (acetyl-transferring), homodimeric type [Actinomycetota bacterium]
MLNPFQSKLPDADEDETREWVEAIDEVINASPTRARWLLDRLLNRARSKDVKLAPLTHTDYVNTIPPQEEPNYPGDEKIEERITLINCWNAAMMVLRANAKSPSIGGHLSTYTSMAQLFEVALNHFLRGHDAEGGADQVFYQGHADEGIYARAYLEGRWDEARLDEFRHEAFGGGLSSYNHPRLMPDFWEFPTVSMGLGPLLAIYQARFNRYLHHRGIKDTSKQRVWGFFGDGEMDEPEATGGLSLAGRARLDNLTFVINCNLQRLDGPVRGNGKTVQELEGLYRGAGWHVIKVLWGREWDRLFAQDTDGALVDRLNETLDGELQKYAVEPGAYMREHLFGGNSRLEKMVEDWSDEDLKALGRGGHDLLKIHAAFRLALDLKDAPVVVLAQTVKGWGLGPGAEARNVTHQATDFDKDDLKALRDRLEVPVSDDDIGDGTGPYYHPGADSDEVRYLQDRRKALGGPQPERRVASTKVHLPREDIYREFAKGSERPIATTMAFVRLLRQLMKDEEFGRRIVPIIPDEARTFGMESLFPQFKIYEPQGQRYEPVDADHVLAYREARDGQILEEGITEAGSVASFSAAGTSYATHGEPMIPFFIFYSMFGWQRAGDLLWSAGDQRARGFLLGATAGRTTLNGEGLQHEDGHSHILASTNPACVAYDPAFAHETAVIIKDGLQRMVEDNEDIFYYLTLYNEPYEQPKMLDGSAGGILRGIYLFREAADDREHKVQLFGSGAIMQQVLRAADLLAEEHDIAADVWSVTSYQQLMIDGLEVERWNFLHPDEGKRIPYVSSVLQSKPGPVIAASDYVKALPGLISRWVPQTFLPLGTDGFGRSDSREELRSWFEIDAEHIVVATLAALADGRAVKPRVVRDALRTYKIDPERVSPYLASQA